MASMAGAWVKVRPVPPLGTRLKVNVWPDSLGGPELMLLVKPGTVCGPESSSIAGGSAGRLKVGASLTALTVIVKSCGALVLLLGGGALGPLSCKVTRNVAVPLALGAAVKVRLPVTRLMVGAWVKVNPPVAPSGAMLKVKVWPDSL